MLKRVLAEIRNSRGPLSLDEISRTLDIEPSALQGMIAHLVQLGHLRDDEAQASIAMSCSRHAWRRHCGQGSCPGPQGCPFATKMPATYSLPLSDSPSDAPQ